MTTPVGIREDIAAYSFDHIASAPDKWPSFWSWISTSRRNAIELFPKSVYVQPRVDHSVFGHHLAVVSDPGTIRHICGVASQKYRLSNLHLRLLRPAFGNGLIVAEGKSWTLQRRMAVKLTRSPTETEKIVLTTRRIDDMVDNWVNQSSKSDSALDLLEDVIAVSLDLVALHAFSHVEKVATDELLQVIPKHRRAMEKFDLFDVTDTSPWFVSPKMRTARRIVHSLDPWINSLIANNPLAVAAGKLLGKTGTEPRDFAVSIMAGYESTTITILWLLGILASRPDLVREIRAEPSSSSGNIFDKDLTSSRCSILGKCVLETLRLYPPLPLIYRTAITDDSTPVGSIRKGTLVCMAPWIVQRHETLWEQPSQFDWKRFDGLSKIPDGYMPFGLGARQCAGMHMGLRLTETVVRRILERCTLSLFNEHLPPPRMGLTLRPLMPIRFNIASRESAIKSGTA